MLITQLEKIMATALEDYNFVLPPHLIATDALVDRTSCRLLYLGRDSVAPHHDSFKNIANYLRPTDVLVVNNTKVMKARIVATLNGYNAEILLVHKRENGHWSALIYCKKQRLARGARLQINGAFVDVLSDNDETGCYEITSDIDLAKYSERHGEIPLPPYMKRKACESDEQNYQTVYAKHVGAVAAPTAGLHFTDDLLQNLRNMGVTIVEITLHVGPGTFMPIRCSDIRDHKMHSEHFMIDEHAAQTLNQAKARGQRIIPVGSTSMRVLEHMMHTAANEGHNQFVACASETSIFIRPGHKFLACDGIITNFHIPRSSLLVLISALAGRERVLNAYEEAVAKEYRFYSYGDACFFERA